MKKRLLSLALALGMCLGLAVPALAVDVSGLDANIKKAYDNVLSAEINQYGIASLSNSSGLEYAALEDMDADGTPELIVIRYEGVRAAAAVINIWTMRNGNAVQTVNEYISAGGAYTEARIFLVRKPGQVAVCDSFEWYKTGWGSSLMDSTDEEWTDDVPLRFQLHYADGTTDEISAAQISDMDTARAALRKEWTEDDIDLLGSGGTWLHDDNAVEALKQVQTALSSGFTDVQPGAYYAGAVTWAVGKGITTGTSATTFSPGQTCTTAQILTFLWRANGSPKQTGSNPFSDVSSGSYYYDAALWAYSKGLVSGNKFNPSTACTRAMTVTYLWKLAGSPDVQGENYKPLTLTETWNGNTCTITFDAASVKQSSLKLCEDQVSWDGNGIEHNEKVVSGTLITVPSGSRVKIDNPGGVDTPWGPDAIETKWYCADRAGIFHSEAGISSETLSNGEVIKDNAIAPFVMNGTTYLLSTASVASSFTDVPVYADYAQAVAWAVEKEITSGTSATTFSPNATCTRGQIVTFLYRAMG